VTVFKDSLKIHDWEGLKQLAEFDPSYLQLGGE
jgi:hypothetical protein